jgi:hypothetical protein
MYLDVGMGGSAGGEFQFRTSNAFSLILRANSSGVYTPGIMSATGSVYGLELWSTQSSGDEGGQLNLAKAATNTTLAGNVIVDVFQNKVRFFENGGTNRGAYIDLTAAAASVGTNLLASGGGGTPGGSNTYVQFNDGGAFGGNGQFVYNKVTNTLTVGNVAANANGQGTNFLVGDDGYIGDINIADTIGIKGQQNGANGYIVFGNADSTSKLGRAGSGPLTYAGAFSASGNVTGGNVLTGGLISATSTVTGSSLLGTVVSASGNITGGNLITSAAVSAASVSASGTVTAASTVGGVITGSSVSVTGTVTGASTVGGVITGSSVSVTGTVTGASTVGGVITGSSTSVTGNVTGGNVLTGGLISATANITGGNILTAGLISATGNITGGNITIPGSANISTFIGNVFFGSVPAQPTWYSIAPLNLNNSLVAATKVQLNLINTGGGAGSGSAIDFYTYQISVAAANAEARIAGIDDGNFSAYLSLQTKTPGSSGTNPLVERVKIDSTGASVVANITGGNLLTGGLISATATITGGNLATGGTASATGNITGGNVLTGGLISATGNATAGNLITAGLASITGNVNIGNATGVTWANAGGVRAWTYYNNSTTSLDTIFL